MAALYALPVGGPPLNARAYALVDEDDAHLIVHRWRLGTGPYVIRSGYREGERHPAKRVTIPLHREILGLAPGDPREGDHVNGDRLDNRRANLRIVTRAQNAQNMPSIGNGGASGHRGVSWDAQTGKWRVSVRVNSKTYTGGRFADELDAAAAARALRAQLMSHSSREAPAAREEG